MRRGRITTFAVLPLLAAPLIFDQARPGYTRGAPEAKVHVIEFSDFGCPYCAQFARDVYPELHRDYVATGRVRWTYVPFVMGNFANGAAAAMAAECAAEQGVPAFWRMHDELFETQREWRQARSPADLFRRYATSLGLDAGGFATCLEEQRPVARIRASNRAADRVGVRATPSFFINGKRVEGALPARQFRMLLDQALGS
jgi:protein-disulfide isomerase